MPDDAIAFFVSEKLRLANVMSSSPKEQLGCLRRILILKQLISALVTLYAEPVCLAPFVSVENKKPGIFLVLSSKRREWFEAQGYDDGDEWAPSRAELYGKIAHKLTVEGDHIPVVGRCISLRDSKFESLARAYLD